MLRAEGQIGTLADHVATQNGRVGKVEGELTRVVHTDVFEQFEARFEESRSGT